MSKTSEASARAHIRRESLDIYNRLHSIDADIAFVKDVRGFYPTFPLIPNLRCGAWYTDPAIYRWSSRHWSFNLRRPNIHLLPIIATHGGLILVDSTRAGKRLPDALSKTVPIWCAVINRATRLRSLLKRRTAKDTDTDGEQAEEEDAWDAATDLRTPPGAVSAHEHGQIAARLDSWATALAESSYALPELARQLRPLWVTPASARFPHVASDASFLPVICVSASRAVDVWTERRTGGFSYVQGSGDDHESWALGLTPQLFWRHRAELLACSRKELEAVVARLVAAIREAEQSPGREGFYASWSTPPTPVQKVGGRVLLCALADLPKDLPASLSSACEPDNDEETAFVVVYTSVAPPDYTDKSPPTAAHPHFGEAEPGAATLRESEDVPRVLRMHLPPGRRGRHMFVHEVLPRSVSFASSHLSLGRRICVAGGDEGIGVALVLLHLFFDDGGSLRSGTPSGAATGKGAVRTRLEWIVAGQPQVNPARAILKRVNDFLLSPHSPHLYRQDGGS
ncbi:tRNA A64-2'-O-ribosylphosphate transferase [Russula compacta]|nr:tRNA A64-2'-O-ribosylphosphate transferase [Russula compacta]